MALPEFNIWIRSPLRLRHITGCW